MKDTTFKYIYEAFMRCTNIKLENWNGYFNIAVKGFYKKNLSTEAVGNKLSVSMVFVDESNSASGE